MNRAATDILGEIVDIDQRLGALREEARSLRLRREELRDACAQSIGPDYPMHTMVQNMTVRLRHVPKISVPLASKEPEEHAELRQAMERLDVWPKFSRMDYTSVRKSWVDTKSPMGPRIRAMLGQWIGESMKFEIKVLSRTAAGSRISNR